MGGFFVFPNSLHVGSIRVGHVPRWGFGQIVVVDVGVDVRCEPLKGSPSSLSVNAVSKVLMGTSSCGKKARESWRSKVFIFASLDVVVMIAFGSL